MRRFARFLLNTITALSLTLFVATAALWVRSYWRADWIGSERWQLSGGEFRNIEIYLYSGRGGVLMGIDIAERSYVPERDSVRVAPLELGTNDSPEYPAIQLPQGGECWSALGFGIGKYSIQGIEPDPDTDAWRTARYWRGFCPIWVFALLTALLPILRIHRRLRDRRARRRGLCSVCGYDLRATAERCPECGTTPNRTVDAPRWA